MYHIKADKRNVITCELIIKALDALITEMEFDQISVKLLATRAGVGRATFYRSFDTIQDVLVYQTDEIIRELFDWISTDLYEKNSISDQDIMTSFFAFWAQHAELPTKLRRANRFWILEQAFDAFLKTRLTFIKSILQLPENEWRYFVRIRKVVLMGLLEEWIAADCMENPQELAAFLGKATAPLYVSWEKIQKAQSSSNAKA